MVIWTIFYVSMATLHGEDPEAVLTAITETSVQRNGLANVTGALVFGGRHFAQILEGDREAVERIMASIAKDPRHRGVRYLENGPRPVRRFADWRVAFAGPSHFVQRQLVQALDDADTVRRFRSCERLERFMLGMSKD